MTLPYLTDFTTYFLDTAAGVAWGLFNADEQSNDFKMTSKIYMSLFCYDNS